ncbi:MAG: CBO2463/CBO2479 domain-containing protein [Lachnospiraceae bacterium]
MDYQINPVLMGGLVKEISGDMVKVHLHGRLGVITVPKSLIVDDTEIEIGNEMQFYFSYLWVNEQPYDYDSAAIDRNLEISPCLLGATIIEVNDTAVKVEMIHNLGTVAVPRRWVFTPAVLETGQNVEFYFSCMKIIGKRDIPKEFI